MTTSINRKAIYAVFTDADNLSASFTERLMALGIASRAEAKPFAMEWAAKKHNVSITQGLQGAKLPRDSAAERAMNRVLSICYPKADLPKPKKTSANKADPVAKLFTQWQALSAAEKRRFTTMQLKA
jgi:hypothetical protein